MASFLDRMVGIKDIRALISTKLNEESVEDEEPQESIDAAINTA